MLLIWVAIANAWIFIAMVLILMHRHGKFDLAQYQISRLDSEHATHIVYRVCFTIFCLGQILVVSILLHFYITAWLYLLPLFAGSILGLLLIVFTTKRNAKIHRYLGGIIFPLVCAGGLLFGGYLIRINILIAVLGIICTALMIASLVPFIKNKTLAAKYSLVYFLGLAMWNTVNLVPLLYNIVSV